MRYLVDECALSTLARCALLGERLETFASTVLGLLRNGEGVGLTSGWAAITVADGDLGSFLSAVEPSERDAAHLTMRALDRCTAWDDRPHIDIDPMISVDGQPWESFAVAYATALASQGRVAGCITVQGCHSPGVHGVTGGEHQPADVVFVVGLQDCRIVHRLRFSIESVPEHEFFSVAEKAFPGLVFAENVTFRRFDGPYETLRAPVVDHLAALDDGFLQEYATANGDLRIVSSKLRISMSIEGNTRGSEKLMRLRDVSYRERSYRCEIHSKIQPHRNRIHFHPGDDHSGGRVVIGIFVSHLET